MPIDKRTPTLMGNTFNGATQLVQMGSDNKLPAVDGSNLTNLPAGGTDDHSELDNLAYADSGHTGFANQTDFENLTSWMI
jgi:hypothetical protein